MDFTETGMDSGQPGKCGWLQGYREQEHNKEHRNGNGCAEFVLVVDLNPRGFLKVLCLSPLLKNH